MITGVKWTTFSTIILAAVGILKISILTRFLDKADFGLMAMVTFVLGFMELFNDMGLTTAILHKQGVTKAEYSSLYWFNWMTSILFYSLLIFITPLISSFYNQPILLTLIPLLGVNLLATAIGRQFKVIEQKKLLFKQIAYVEVFSASLSLVIALYLAIYNYGVYSLVYSMVFQYLFSNILFLIIGIKKQGLHFRCIITEVRPFLRIGVYQVGGQIISFFNNSVDILIIGKLFSPEVLGGYNLAKQLVMRPGQFINPIVLKVASPALAKYQFDKVSLKNNYLKLINVLFTIALPIYILLIIFAPLIVNVVYGPGFGNITILVRILSIYMLFRTLWSPISSLVVATGRTDLEFKWSLIALLILPIMIFIGAQFGISQVAYGITTGMVILFIPSWKFLIQKMTGATLSEYVLAITKINIKNFNIKNDT